MRQMRDVVSLPQKTENDDPYQPCFKKIVNLFVGTADDAKKDGADILEPTTDTVKYSDGTTDEVYGFDVPVEALDEEFDLAILGTKGEWYDHKVSVSDPQETDN